MPEETNPFGAGFEESQAGKFVKWTDVGQSVKGICTDIYEKENTLKGGEMQKIVVLELEDGTEVQVALKDQSMVAACKKLLKGQWVGFIFSEQIPSKSKGYQDFKLIKTYLGQLDEEWSQKNVHNGKIEVEDIPFV